MISPPPMQVPSESLRRAPADPMAVARARLAGERPDCSCRPIHAWPLGGPVVGYHDRCAEHAGEEGQVG